MNSFPKVLLSVDDLDNHHIDELLVIAKKFKKYVQSFPSDFKKKTTSLPQLPSDVDYKNILGTTFFQENSTRTKLSFLNAFHRLDLRYLPFESHTSSLTKGENLEQTFYTLQALGVHLCIFRGDNSNELDCFRDNPPFAIINGGDGKNEHPTQALLDLCTMIECGCDPKRKTFTILGDAAHSRVSHSLIKILLRYGAKVIISGPENCCPKQLPEGNISFTTDSDAAINQSDYLYLLRIQYERHLHAADKALKSSYQTFANYHKEYGINLERLKHLGKSAIPIFHAGPANVGVEIDDQAIKSDLYMGHQQVEHATYMRMAIIEAIFSS